MELFNELPVEREQAIDDFLTFIGIYESKRRHRSLRALLKKHRSKIQDKVCLEAGAGKGLFSREMADLGARKVYSVERSDLLYNLLNENVSGLDKIETVQEGIEFFEPPEPIDVLFHEFYGSLILDESILALQQLKFKPGTILPDGGRLWCMPIMESQIGEKDKTYEPAWKDLLAGALISDVFETIPFKPKWKVFDWDLSSSETTFTFELPEKADFLAFCGEITHQGESVLKLWYTHNWPVVYTPATGTKFQLRFNYDETGFTPLHFDWID